MRDRAFTLCIVAVGVFSFAIVALFVCGSIKQAHGDDGTPSGSWRKVAPGLSRIEVPGGWLYRNHPAGSIAFVPAAEVHRG